MIRLLSIIVLVSFFFSTTVTPVAAAITYLYDANGNLTSDGTRCFEYNEANQLKKVKNCGNNQTIAEYVYDHTGKRIVKKEYVNGVLNNTVYSPSDEYETKKKSDGTTENTTYYKVNDEVVAKKNPDGSLNYYHNDHLGSNSVLTNQSGGVVEKTTYEPYGEVKSGGTKSKYQYTGQEKDQETGLNYYEARYYDPHTHHFTQPDDIIQDWYDPQTLNRYSYVKNNPLRYTDPSGHIAWVPLMIIGAGAALGATETLAGFMLDNPNATLQQKVTVAAGGAVIGASATVATMYVVTSVAGVAIVGGLSSGLQQVTSNAVGGQKVFQTNVLSQAAIGTVASGVAAKAVGALKLVPNTLGRPINLNQSRSLAASISKNSINAIHKETVPGVIATNFNIIANSLMSIVKNITKNVKQKTGMK